MARIVVDVPMRWGDMDAYGHINNVNSVRLMEEARVHALGVPGGTGREGVPAPATFLNDVSPSTQVLVVDHRVRYLSPLEYRNVPVRVEVWIANIKAASFDVCYEFFDPVENTLCIKASTTLAFFSTETQRLLRISSDEKRRMERFSGPPVFGERKSS
ncbi:acyl-CoA thioesterase [Neomicrococcus aestuarii]|uniref:4-hydroxybenzoyl-CoA thioesterase n=1 Tax=Neomicrococcus aestuarii TaxID=556325 RepID=A0A1L2ZMH6_9MICC|nr:acyl-CoA thioesterase [Neomicrococcus aestuarii]APF40584.1 4-hydroxybenzoyl-CoA thioesterase [Neomicrococcus aestuarii]MBB5512275.1 acyl-CoA thioester hydrolase [Neomicrococcus aestuarii]